jgi:hypothetical protein
MKKRLCVLAAFLVALLFVDEAGAIPAFARKYNMSCTTCHQPFPKLKPYGDEFAGNGFQVEGNEPARAFRDTGDDQLLLMRDLPVAIRVDGFLRWLPQNTDGGRSDFQSPFILKLLSGGQIAHNVAYYFYFLAAERGEVVGLEDAFIMFNDLFGKDLDLYVGQFQVSDPLFKGELRLSLEEYAIYGRAPGLSTATLKYDRGAMVTCGLPSGTDLALEVVSGAGLEAMSGDIFDTDPYKNVMVRLSQDIGEHVRVGGFAYYGKEEQSGEQNSLWMAGPDLTLAVDRFQLNLQYVERRDDNPFFLRRALEQKTRGGFAELIFLPDGDRSTWYAALLYNGVDSDDESLKYETATAHLGYLLGRNLRLVGEYTYDFQAKANRLSVGLVSAF